MRLAINGYGRVAKALIDYWQDEENSPNIVLVRNSSHQWRGNRFINQELRDKKQSIEELGELDFDYWLELTPGDQRQTPALHRDLIELVDRGISLIIANKLPLLHDYQALKEKADDRGVFLGLSGVLGASLASYALVHYGTMGSRILSMKGILNGTTNFILEKMEDGMDFEEALGLAQELGIAETDPSRDLEGLDSAVKMALLASLITGKNISYKREDIRGIQGINRGEIESFIRRGKRIKLVASFEDGRIRVEPESYSMDQIFYHVSGSEKALYIETDDLSDMTLIGGKSGLRQLAASLNRDLLMIEEIKNLNKQSLRPWT